MRQTGLFEALFLCRFISQPDLAGPETVGPFGIVHLRIKIVDAVGILHAGGEIVQAAAHLFDGVMDRVVELGIGQFRIVCKVHEKSPLYVPIVASLCKKFNNLVYKLK